VIRSRVAPATVEPGSGALTGHIHATGYCGSARWRGATRCCCRLNSTASARRATPSRLLLRKRERQAMIVRTARLLLVDQRAPEVTGIRRFLSAEAGVWPFRADVLHPAHGRADPSAYEMRAPASKQESDMLGRRAPGAPQYGVSVRVPLYAADSSHRRTTEESQRLADRLRRCGGAEGSLLERGRQGRDLGAAGGGVERSRDRASAWPCPGEREQPPGENGRHSAQSPPAPREVPEPRGARGDLARDRRRPVGAQDRPGARSFPHDDHA
jgi:hypothetical protein